MLQRFKINDRNRGISFEVSYMDHSSGLDTTRSYFESDSEELLSLVKGEDIWPSLNPFIHDILTIPHVSS